MPTSMPRSSFDCFGDNYSSSLRLLVVLFDTSRALRSLAAWMRTKVQKDRINILAIGRLPEKLSGRLSLPCLLSIIAY